MDKLRWTDPSKAFTAFFGKASLGKQKDIQNYVSRTPSQSPFLHKFREERKKKWVAGALKF